MKLKKTKGFSLIELMISLALFSFVLLIMSNFLSNVAKTQKQLQQSTSKRQTSYIISEKIKKELSSLSYIFKPNQPLPPGFIDDRYIASDSTQNSYENKFTINSDVVDKGNTNSGCILEQNPPSSGNYFFNDYNGDSLYYISNKMIDVNTIIGNDNTSLKTSYPVPPNSKITLQSINFLYLSKDTKSSKSLNLSLFKDDYLYKGEKTIIKSSDLNPISTPDQTVILPEVSFENIDTLVPSNSSYNYTSAKRFEYRRNIMYRLLLRSYKMTIEDVNKPENMLGIFPISTTFPTVNTTINPSTIRTSTKPVQDIINYNLSDILTQQENAMRSTFNLLLQTTPSYSIPSISLPSPKPVIKTVLIRNVSKEPIIDYDLIKGSLTEEDFLRNRIKSRLGLLFEINRINNSNPKILQPNNFKQIDSLISNIGVSINILDEDSEKLDNYIQSSFTVETLNNRKL